MSGLGVHINEYLRLHRSLGYKLGCEGVVLPCFAKYLEAAGATTVTTDLAVAWAQLPEGGSAKVRPDRLIAVRGFAEYLTTIDAATQVPLAGVLDSRHAADTFAAQIVW